MVSNIFQGINTKVAQTVAKTLNIPMDMISVMPTNSFVSPNTSATWGSTGTDSTCTVFPVWFAQETPQCEFLVIRGK